MIKYLTPEEHQSVVRNLIKFEEKVNITQYHKAGVEYTSLMVCFLSQNFVAAKSLFKLQESLGRDWFPSTIGYAIVRTMFEVNINAPLYF